MSRWCKTEEKPYEWGGFLNGVTVTPYKNSDGTNINRETTYEDWEHANKVDRENKEKERIAKQSLTFNNNIRHATEEFGSKYVLPTVMAAAAPSTLIPGLAAWIGGAFVNETVNLASDGKYDSWGSMVQDLYSHMNNFTKPLAQLSYPPLMLSEFAEPVSELTGNTNYGNLFFEASNPGSIYMGGFGGAATIQEGTGLLAGTRSRVKSKPVVKQGDGIVQKASPKEIPEGALTTEELLELLNKADGDENIYRGVNKNGIGYGESYKSQDVVPPTSKGYEDFVYNANQLAGGARAKLPRGATYYGESPRWAANSSKYLRAMLSKGPLREVHVLPTSSFRYVQSDFSDVGAQAMHSIGEGFRVVPAGDFDLGVGMHYRWDPSIERYVPMVK